MIYLAIFFLLLSLAYVVDFRGHRLNSNLWYRILLVIFVAVSGLRYKVGGDTHAYMDFFEDYPFIYDLKFEDFIFNNFDPLWLVISSLSKSIVNDFFFFQLLHSFFINVVMFSFINKNTQYRFSAVLIYFLFFFIYFNTEIMRESLAICFFLLAYPYFRSQKWGGYLILSVIAFLFHSSAFVLFVFPFFRNLRLTFLSFVFISTTIFGLYMIINYYPDILQYFFFTDRLALRFEIYSDRRSNIVGQIYYFILYALFPLCILLLNRKMKRAEMFNELYVVYFFLVLLFISISGFSRILNYVIPFMVVFFADFLTSLYRRRYFMAMSGFIVIGLFVVAIIPKVIYYSESTSHLSYGSYRFHKYYPYSSIFSKKEFPQRETIYREGLKESI
ncbi:EpsG family protein [Lunatimonas salinarum]|uniref:EpsG family protein n=1 Tax=Lunatimonas salinarum TaxID=1774590 RepID=UPI001AE05357